MPDGTNNEDVGTQGGGGGGNVVTKQFNKQSFREPMKKLLVALKNLNTQLQKGSLKKGGGYLLEDVLQGYNGIVELTGHGGSFECNQKDEDDDDAGDNVEEDGSNTDDNNSDMLVGFSDLSKDSDSGSDSQSSDNSTSSDDS